MDLKCCSIEGRRETCICSSAAFHVQIKLKAKLMKLNANAKSLLSLLLMKAFCVMNAAFLQIETLNLEFSFKDRYFSIYSHDGWIMNARSNYLKRHFKDGIIYRWCQALKFLCTLENKLELDSPKGSRVSRRWKALMDKRKVGQFIMPSCQQQKGF